MPAVVRTLGALLLGALVANGEINEDGQEIMSFKPPELSEEEQEKKTLPTHMNCAACVMISHKVSAQFLREERTTKNKPISELAMTEAFEKACATKQYENVGLRSDNDGGLNRLVGEGLKTSDKPGMTQGGGPWAARVSMRCEELEGNLEDYKIYEGHRAAIDASTTNNIIDGITYHHLFLGSFCVAGKQCASVEEAKSMTDPKVTLTETSLNSKSAPSGKKRKRVKKAKAKEL